MIKTFTENTNSAIPLQPITEKNTNLKEKELKNNNFVKFFSQYSATPNAGHGSICFLIELL